MTSTANKKRQPRAIRRARVEFAGNPHEFTLSVQRTLFILRPPAALYSYRSPAACPAQAVEVNRRVFDGAFAGLEFKSQEISIRSKHSLKMCVLL
jgi:hypothetical protein